MMTFMRIGLAIVTVFILACVAADSANDAMHAPAAAIAVVLLCTCAALWRAFDLVDF